MAFGKQQSPENIKAYNKAQLRYGLPTNLAIYGTIAGAGYFTDNPMLLIPGMVGLGAAGGMAIGNVLNINRANKAKSGGKYFRAGFSPLYKDRWKTKKEWANRS